jgi:2-oxoglutarate ferredoxin oxidoreductase subunit alpha
MSGNNLAIAICGAGGAGAISTGELLLQGWARAGGYGLLRKAYGPQIRGGESAALLKLTESGGYTAAQEYDLLLALDWANFSRFEDEIEVRAGAHVICEAKSQIPQAVLDCDPKIHELPFRALATQAHPEGRENMLALGLLGRLLGLEIEDLAELAGEKLKSKPAAYREAASLNIALGASQELNCELQPPMTSTREAWCLTGNQAAAYGALQAGIRFAAAYPITPASDALEWLAGALETVGGQLVQAEDELAAINMCLGAAFGGVPALTATSGPGLALMTESLGLAVASETPVCVLNVMRVGPSTGIPTKSEQGDLDIALYGLHGDAPHLVLAPLDTADCVFTSGWAVNLAQQLQTPAIVLSDQFLGQSTAVVSRPRSCDPVSGEAAQPGDYLRYQLTESGISPMAVPGDSGLRFVADGLEHTEQGRPSARHADHLRQLDKRQRKLEDFDYGEDWAEIAGDGPLALVSFGSTAGVADEVAQRLSATGISTRTISLRLLAPLQKEALAEALRGCEQVVVIEQNHSAQLFRYLRGAMDFPAPASSCSLPGPVPLDPGDVMKHIEEVMQT